MQIADHLWEWSSDPTNDVERFLDAVFYNWLIVGPDAHAKNYSIFLRGEEVTLSPLYDVCSDLPCLSNEQAIEGEPLSMSVGDGFKVGDADASHIWEGAAVRMDLDPRAFCNRVVEMAEGLEKAVADSVDALSSAISITPRIAALQTWAAKRSQRSWNADTRTTAPVNSVGGRDGLAIMVGLMFQRPAGGGFYRSK